MLFWPLFSKVLRDLKVLREMNYSVVHRLSTSIRIPEKEERICLWILSLPASISWMRLRMTNMVGDGSVQMVMSSASIATCCLKAMSFNPKNNAN